jgi:hypothetical protein
MIRILLEILLPLITPVAIYAVWAHFDAKRQGKGMPGWEEGHWFWVTIFGGALSIATVIYFGVQSSDTGGTYVPSHVEDGKVVPGKFK